MTVQLEEGKHYWAANGEKWGPVERRPNTCLDDPYPWIIYYATRDNPRANKIYSSGGINRFEGEFSLVAEWTDEEVDPTVVETFGPLPGIKAELLTEAGNIVNGVRRKAYGTPEDNFARIARFWQVYFENTGRDVQVTAADVSPMMRLMKEARLCETPDHKDSFVDIIGYALTGAEVNNVAPNDKLANG